MRELRNTPARAWQRMLSGRRLDLLDPVHSDVEIEDIAQGLARVARWNGQTGGEHALTVAQHSLIVEDIAVLLEPEWSNKWRLAALLHDGAEYVIGDLISPFKAAIGNDYRSLEAKILAAIHERFDLPSVLPDEIARQIKICDRVAAYFEATLLAGFEIDEAKKYFGAPDEFGHGELLHLDHIEPMSSSQAQSAFLQRFASLYHQHAGEKLTSGL